MAIEIPINTTIQVPATSTLVITSGSVSKLVLDFDNTHALLEITYLGSAKEIVATRFFKVSGLVYGGLIYKQVTGILAEIVVGSVAQFAMDIIVNPTKIDGVDVVEIEKGEFMAFIRRGNETLA